MNNKIISKTISGLLLCSMVGYTLPVFGYTKDETVYSKLDSTGNNYKTIVSTHIQNTEKNSLINDMSDLLDLVNTNGDETYTQDGNKIVWNANKNDIYYQGETEKELPVECKISYELDGKELSAEEIVGKSGSVKVKLQYTNKEERIVDINGNKVKMYVPFVVVAGTIVKNDNNQNIAVSNGKIIDDGTKSVVVGIAMPGLQESLDVSKNDIEIPSNIEITMDAKDFEMGSIVSYVTPKVLEDDDLKIFDKLDTIYSKSNELKEASKMLVDGTNSLKEGTEKLNNGTHQLSSELNSKINQYEIARKKVDNKEEIKKQIVEILNQEIKKMLPSLEKEAQSEVKNTIARHKTELEQSVVETSLKYTEEAIEEKLAEVQKNGGSLLTEEQEKQLENALAKDIEAVYKETESNIQTKSLLQELQSDMKKEAKAKVDAVIKSKKVNATTLTPEQMAAYAQAYSAQIASIKAINPDITNEQALQIIGVVSNYTLDNVEKEIDTKIDSISVESVDKIEEKIEKEISEYISKVAQNVADKFTKGNTEALKMYEKQIKDAIVNALKQELSKNKVIQTYANQVKKELSDTIDSVASKTAEELSSTYTETIASEVANNLIRKQLSGELEESEIDKELSKYETLINSKLNEVDNGVGTLKSALKELTNGTEQLADGAEQLSDGMSKFDVEGIQKICDFINGDAKNISLRIEKLTELSKEYNNFTMLDEGNEGNVKFIMIIDSLKKKEE